MPPRAGGRYYQDKFGHCRPLAPGEEIPITPAGPRSEDREDAAGTPAGGARRGRAKAPKE